jgi:hypothetical protein
VLVHVLRLRHVQLRHREDDGVHEQLRRGSVLQQWGICMHGVPRRHVHSCFGNLHLHKLRGREVPDHDGPDDVHELCMRHLQYQCRPHHSLHDDLRHRALLEHRCQRLHGLPSRQVRHRHRHLYLHVVCVRHVQHGHRPHHGLLIEV